MKNVNKMYGYCNFSHIVYEKVIEKCNYPNSIIELGCGNGGNLGKFTETNIRIGIDPKKENIESALHRDIDCQFIWGDHGILENYKWNTFDLGLTVSVLDHIEDYKIALSSMLYIAKEIILIEPYIKGVERRAFKNETRWWKITWYHDYEKFLENISYTIESCPLYDIGSGKLYHLIHIKCKG